MPNANATLSEKIVDAYLTGRDDAVIDAIESTFNDAQTRLNIDSFAELATVTDADTGDIVVWREKGFRYQCVTSGEHFDYTGSGGLKWKLLSLSNDSFPALAAGVDEGGDTASDAAITTAIAAIPTGGGRLVIPVGQISLNSALILDRDNISINGQSQKSSEIEIAHDGVGLTFEGQEVNLRSSRTALSDLMFTKASGNALDANGFPQSGWSGTAIKTINAFCSDFQRIQVDRFDKGLDLGSAYMCTFNQFTARNCWKGLVCSAEGDGTTTGNVFIGGVFNNSAFDLTNGEKFTFFGTDFEASSTTCTVSDKNIFINCRFERMHINRDFFTWLDIEGDYNKFIGSQFFWDATTFVDDAETDFYVDVTGSYNEIEVNKLYIHQNVIKFSSGSEGNKVEFKLPFTDYANTNNNNTYRRSGRIFIDAGTRNKVVFDNEDGRVEVVGSDSMEAKGNLSNYLRYDSLSNLTINSSTLTISQSDIAGPCGIPATHVDNKKFTIASTGATIRARTPDLVTADGSTVYSLGCWVYLTGSTTQVTKVRIGDGSGVFTDIYPSDGTGRWHWVPVFVQPANASAVQLMIQAEGDVGDVFYIALPSVGEGNIPAYVPVPTDKTSWTTKTEAKQIGIRDINYSNTNIDELLATYVEDGTFTPSYAGFTGTVSAATGRYTRIGDVVHYTIRITGTSFSASAFVATIDMPIAGGDGSLTQSNTNATTNYGTGIVLNGVGHLPAISATNSLTVQGTYRITNV